MYRNLSKKDRIKKDLYTLLMMGISAFVYSIAITSFSNVGGIYPGGFAGISRIVSDISLRFFKLDIPFGVIYFILNIFPTILVFRYIGKRFTIFSVIQYILVSVITIFLPPFLILDDPMLIAIFGGLLSGVGIGIALHYNASSGGTDFIAIYVANKFNRSTWNYVMLGNILILSIAGLIFGWEKALYSIVYQFVSTQVVERMHERYKMETLTIITKKPQDVADSVLEGTRHGITEIKGEGFYSHTDMTILYMVINSFQRRQVIKAVLKADPKAFVNIQETTMIIGNYYQQPLD